MAPHLIDLRKADDVRDVVHQAVQALAEGKLVAFPTETVYGLAANARSAEAVERLVDIKGRAPDKPLTLAIKSAEEALDYVPDMSRLASRLTRRCWPGPVTMVLPGDHQESLLRQLPDSVYQSVTSQGSVGLRVPAHSVILEVMQLLAGPLALSSANLSGQSDAVSAEEVVSALGEKVQMVLDDGPSRYGQPSSVVRVGDQGIEILRQGVVAESMLQRLSAFMVLLVCTGNTCRSPMAEAICKDLLAKRKGCKPEELEDHGVIVMSAGISAVAGAPASIEGVQVLEEMGLKLGDHQSQPLSEQLVRHADHVLTMTGAHKAAILEHWPSAADRVNVLCHDRSNVSDPIGGPVEVYRQCAEQIRGELEQWVERFDIL